jgi:glutamate-1-semialdehyde 2,1-aminomutase
MIDKKSFDEGDFVKKIYAAYVSKRPKSELLHKEARRFLPGGDTRTATFYRPFPTFMVRGEGCRLYDVDNNGYTDFANNLTSLVHGHAHPKVVEAVTEQVKRGSILGSPMESQTKLAQEICDRLPSAEKVRFCNSGTEATLGAIRLARAHRKKYKLVKMEGGYHGSHDLVEISIKPGLEKVGPIGRPNSVPEDISIPPNVVSDCIIVPFNNSKVAERIIGENHEDLAAIILEPVLGSAGLVPAEPDFLRTVREVASNYKIPLIFDEVITFRLAKGGCQQIYDVVPDLTALGKIIGGGYPVGAIAGREELMDLFSPLNPTFLAHSGTFNGNPVTMVAGLATLKELTVSEIDRINKLGEKLRTIFSNALEEVGINAQVTGMGSLAQIHFTNQEIKDWRSAAPARIDIRTILHLMLMNRGIFAVSRTMFNISTAMGEKEVTEAGSAVKSCLLEMKPYIEKMAPELISR